MTPLPLVTLAGPVAVMMACGLATFLLAGRVSARALGALGLLTVLAGFFLLFLLLAPLAPGNGALATFVLLGSFAAFKLMNRFESPRPGR
jgi:hypothetical protein